MRLPPPEVVASWPTPNYINPVTRGPVLSIVVLLALSIGVICLGLRLYIRTCILRNIDWDDWLMVAGAFLTLGVTICVVLASTHYGWDLHIWDLTTAQIIASRKVSFAAQFLYGLATMVIRASIFTSYLRLALIGSWFRRLAFVGIWASILTVLSFTVAFYTQCRPLSSYWNLAFYSRDCFNEAPLVMAFSTITAALDFFAWVLPLPTFYNTRLPLAQRLALVTLFSFGLVAVIASCIRIYWAHYILQETYDVTWYGFQLWMWMAVEVQLGLICGCVPWLKSLFKFWKTGQTVTSASGPAHSSGQRAAGSMRMTPVRMGNLGSGKGEFIDLERSSAGGDSQTELHVQMGKSAHFRDGDERWSG